MYSNYNVLVLPISKEEQFQVGDTYGVSKRNMCKYYRFNRLTIKNIDYLHGYVYILITMNRHG